MKTFFTLLSLALIFYSCSSEKDNELVYTISPITSNGISQLKIQLDVPASNNGETILLYQDQAWGQDSLHNVLSSIQVANTEASITKQKDSGWIVIKHPKHLKKLKLTYTLEQDTPLPITTQNVYRPVIQPTYFNVFAHNLFMLPKDVVHAGDSTYATTLNWVDFPEGYTIQNSFGSGQLTQRIENIAEEKFHSAVFTGGDFRVHNIDIKGKNVVFAIRDTWEVFQDSTLVNVLKETLTAQRDFYDDHSQEYFFVSMIPTQQERGSSFQGTGLTNSFALSASNNKNLESNGLVYLLNHELQHNWIGFVIKNDNEEEQYWFSEGFTDYYTIKNIAKDKINGLGKAYFIKEFNEFVRALYASPEKNVPNSGITYDAFWANPDLQKIPYRRGAVFAFYLDVKIQKETKGAQSLDDVLLKLAQEAREHDKKLNHKHFINTVKTVTGINITEDFNNYIEQGKLIGISELYTTMGLTYIPEQQVFDLGFTFSEDRKTIAAIDETSNAYKAGLRKGDKLTSISYYQSPEYPAEFTVKRATEDKQISYLPAKEAAIPALEDTEANYAKLPF